jgi:hypothetical protein
MKTSLMVLAALVVGLAALPCRAQVLTFGGADPTKLIYSPVDTSNPIAVPQQLPSTGFSLASMFPKVHLPTGQKLVGASAFPKPGDMPGANYLKSFRYQYPKAK